MSAKLHEKWLTKSRNDLRSSKILVNDDDPVLDTAIYHTQQCAEKALKAFLAYKGHAIERTHDVVYLIELCADYHPEFTKFEEDAERLNPYSTLFRYPDIVLEPDKQDVTEAIKIAKGILEFVEEKIKPLENPPAP